MEEGAPLRKMLAGFDGRVHYALSMGGSVLELDPLLGKELSIRATGILTCVSCGNRVKKFYGQGFCFPCLRDAPEASVCIIRPELCRAHMGEGRDPAWEADHHNTEHVVYLSYTGGLKVGVTRATQVPVRWIDQGAVAAIVIGRTPYRQLAGLMEVDLKRAFADRTDWRAMLRPVDADVGMERLRAARTHALTSLRHDLQGYLIEDAEPLRIDYPMLAWPPKVTSVQLGRTPEIRGPLVGIKGQYLLWEDGRVLNVRNHAGYHVVAG